MAQIANQKLTAEEYQTVLQKCFLSHTYYIELIGYNNSQINNNNILTVLLYNCRYARAYTSPSRADKLRQRGGKKDRFIRVPL